MAVAAYNVSQLESRRWSSFAVDYCLILHKFAKCHVVLLADVVVLLFSATSFVTAAIFVYTIV